MVFRSRLPLPSLPEADTFDFIFHRGRRAYPGDRVLFRCHETGDTLTLAELEEKSRQFANVLVHKFSIKPNDVITFLAGNSIKYPIAFFGALASGATISPIPVQQDLDAQAILPRLHQSNSTLLIADDETVDLCLQVTILQPNVRLISLGSKKSVDDEHRVSCFSDMLLSSEPQYKGFTLRTPDELHEYNAFIYRTSGSSGQIKSVLTPHAHWTANLLTTQLTVPSDTDPDKDVWVASLPFAYGINAKLNLGLNILLGIPVIILKHSFDATMLPLIDQYAITFLFVVPPLAAQIAKYEKPPGMTLKSIKWLLSAGAPVLPKIRKAVQDVFNGVRLALEWGTTETLLIALQMDDESAPLGSSGTLVNAVEARVIDLDTGEDLGANQRGEILVRNSMAKFAGYKEEAANKDFDADGWFHSGDVGYIDEKMNVFIVDRLKELLRVGDGYGTHMSTQELEAVLFDHAAVSTAVVVGVRDQDTQTEHPTAFVVLRPQFQQADHVQIAHELESMVIQRLGNFKRLSGGAWFVQEYPKVGYKINRKKLKTLVDVAPGLDRSTRLLDVGA